MKLKQHIKDHYDCNKSAFARVISVTEGKEIFPTQVSRWIELDCIWVDGRVYAPKTNNSVR